MSTAARMAPAHLAVPEVWKAVVGYEGRYQVSNQGNVWSMITNRQLRPAPTSKGYLSVVLYDGSSPKKPRSHCVHDLVMAAFVGPKPAGMQVDHGLAGKQCNAVTNLEYVTPQENCRRSVVRGVIVTYGGTASYNAKLSDDDVRAIRAEWRQKKRGTIARLAKRFGVDPMTIAAVGYGKSYKEVS